MLTLNVALRLLSRRFVGNHQILVNWHNKNYWVYCRRVNVQFFSWLAARQEMLARSRKT